MASVIMSPRKTHLTSTPAFCALILILSPSVTAVAASSATSSSLGGRLKFSMPISTSIPQFFSMVSLIFLFTAVSVVSMASFNSSSFFFIVFLPFSFSSRTKLFPGIFYQFVLEKNLYSFSNDFIPIFVVYFDGGFYRVNNFLFCDNIIHSISVPSERLILFLRDHEARLSRKQRVISLLMPGVRIVIPAIFTFALPVHWFL